MTSEIDKIVATAVQRLGSQQATAQWAACVTIWARLWVLARAGWSRWPDAAQRVLAGLQLALVRVGQLGDQPSEEIVLLGLETLDVEDDGSPEWQHMVDLAAMLGEALDDGDPLKAVESTIRTFLEGIFNVLANEIALQAGRAISQLVAEDEISKHGAWRASVALIESL